MSLTNIVRKVFRSAGLELTRTATHRGICLDADMRRLLTASKKLTLLDVGANVGAFSLRLAKIFPQADIFAFEPIAETYSVLCEKTKGERGIKNENIALGAVKGTVSMSIEEDSEWNKIILDPENSEKQLVEVAVSTVEDYCNEKGIEEIDLLKTDCEGFDAEVIKGSIKLFEEHKVKLVYCEVDFSKNGLHGDFFKIHDILNQYGYSFYALYDYSGIGQKHDTLFCNAMWISPELLT